MTQELRLCPKCSHTRKKHGDKCLSVNLEEGLFKCHHPHCDYQGKITQANWSEFVGEGIPYTGIVHATDKPKPDIKLPESKIPEWARTIFKHRKITEATLQRNKIACNGREIVFPYFREGEVVNVKYRTRDKKFRQETGGEKIFYGLDDIKDCCEAIIVEGEFDKLAFEEAGFKEVLSVPDGAPSPETKNYLSKFSYLENCEKEIEHITKWTIAVDKDDAGDKLAQELIRRLGAEKCFVAWFPEECKDANETLVKIGPAELISVIDNAKPVPISGVFDYNSIEDAHDRLYHNNGRVGGNSTGWLNVDRFYTVRPGEVTIVTGIPSHGKSEVVDALMVNLAVGNDWRFATFSPENHPIELHVSKLQQKYIGKPFSKSYSGFMSAFEHETSKDWLREHFWYIAPEDHELTVDSIIAKAKVCVLRHGIQGLSIDPWNEIDHSRMASQTETEYISQALTKIRRFARQYGVHVWVIAHPTKLYKDNSGKYPVPTPYDISGSAHFRNKGDNCVTIWRDLEDENRAVEFHVQKIRFREIGKVGIADLNYQVSSGRYRDAQYDPVKASRGGK